MAKVHNYNPKSLANLSPIHTRTTPEQRQENSRKGGLQSAKNSRERRLLSDIIKGFGAKTLPKRKLAALAEKYDVDLDTIEGLTNDAVMVYAQYIRAFDGDTDAARFLRDTSGQAPTQAVQIGPLDAGSVDMASLSDEQIAAQIAELEDDSGAFDGSFDGNGVD